ncbi:hypothetical protein BH09GEM1_BH09GEM1_46020 [soil metagenome]
MDAKQTLEDVVDYLAPRLDTYETAIYLYALRHGPLQGITELVIGFKSARTKMAFGIGEHGKPMSEGTCYKKLASLAEKGCLEILSSERSGTRIRVFLPSEIGGVIPEQRDATSIDWEIVDFFAETEHRALILAREGSRCFYCRASVTDANYVIEHIVSRPEGNGTYRNVVAACRRCNNRKGSVPADNFLRTLYRDGFLSDTELEERLTSLQAVQSGQLRPPAV